jgi:hypothetical protein
MRLKAALAVAGGLLVAGCASDPNYYGGGYGYYDRPYYGSTYYYYDYPRYYGHPGVGGAVQFNYYDYDRRGDWRGHPPRDRDHDRDGRRGDRDGDRDRDGRRGDRGSQPNWQGPDTSPRQTWRGSQGDDAGR